MTACNFKAPNGANSNLYKDLELNFGDVRAAQIWNYTHSQEFEDEHGEWKDLPLDQNGEPTIQWVLDNVPHPESPVVNAKLKALGLLQSELGEKIFEKGEKNSWSLDKILSELKVPKEQKQLILDSGKTTLDDIIVDLLANYSYTIEINTAKDKTDYRFKDNAELADYGGSSGYEDFELEGSKYTQREELDFDGEYRTYFYKDDKKITKREFNETAKKLPSKIIDKNSSYYSNLTVPGGANYTENEIATPAITPSIKGHAQFSTDNGIGWFRADDKSLDRFNDLPEGYKQKLNLITISKENGKYYETHETQGKREISKENALGFVNMLQQDNLSDSKTRRILEVQSDLFQKGRNKEDLEKANEDKFWKWFDLDGYRYRPYDIDLKKYFREDINKFHKLEEITKEQYEDAVSTFQNKPKSTGNQFLQLLNKDNNWVTFFVKSIIQDSAKKGYEKVLFPSGDTAAKIEEHIVLSELIERKQQLAASEQAILDKIEKKENFQFHDQFFDFQLKSINDKVQEDDTFNHIVNEAFELTHLRLAQAEFELEEAVAGGGKFASINKFYEETVFNVLKKQGYGPTRITDEYGNDWYEVNVEPRHLNTFLFSKTTEPIITHEIFGTSNRQDRMPLDKATSVVTDLYEEARNNPDKVFNATAFKIDDLKKPTTNGYTPFELSGLFSSQPIPSNVIFDPLFNQLISNSVNIQAESIEPSDIPALLYEENRLQEILNNTKIPVRDKEGQSTGEFFTAEQEKAAVNTVVALVKLYYFKDNNVSLGSLLADGGSIPLRLDGHRLQYETGYNLPEDFNKDLAKDYAKNIQMVLNSWSDVRSKAIARLEADGMKVSDKSALQNPDSQNDVIDTPGRGLQDWSDSSFELDPKDTASARVKMFISVMRDVTIGTEEEPTLVTLPFSDKAVRDRIVKGDPILGRKTTTIRTAEQSKGLTGTYLTKIDGIKFKLSPSKTIETSDLDDKELQATAKEEGQELVPGMVLYNLEEWKPKKNVLIDKKNFLGFAELVDGNETFQKLLETLYNVPLNLDAYIQTLETEGKNFKPILLEVANRLRGESTSFQNEFMKVMSKQYQEFNILLHSKRKDGFMDMTPINANQGSAIQSVVKQWRENQKNAKIITKDGSGNLVVNETEAAILVDGLEQLMFKYESGELPSIKDELRPFAEQILEANGIIMPEAALDYLFSNVLKLTSKTSVAGTIHEQFQVNEKGEPRGIFSVLVMKLGGLVADDTTTDEESRAAILNNNPLYTSNSPINILAKLAYKFGTKIAANSHYDSENKNIYAFGMNSHLSSSVSKLLNSPEYRNNLALTHLGKNNWLLQRLMNSAKDRETFKLQYVDGLKDSYKTDADGIKRSSMSFREQLLYSLGQFQRQGNKTANFLSLTHSDKGMTPLFTGIQKFSIEKGGALSTVAQEAIWTTFLGEYEEIKAWYTGTVKNNNKTTIEAYNNGAGLYYFIPQFNYDNLAQLEAQGAITKDELELLWISKGVPNTNTSMASLKPLSLRLFSEHWLKPEIERTVARMRTEGFQDGLVDYSYVKKNINKIGVNMTKGGKFFSNGVELTKEQVMDALLPHIATEYVVNSFLMNTALSSLIFGSPVDSYKGKEGMTDNEKVTETLKEYQKRLAGPIAPGHDAIWESPIYKTITLQDDERIHNDLKEIYNDALINGTDAQELVTMKEALAHLKALGLIQDNVYAEMMQIVEKAKGQFYEFEKQEHKDVVFQITKPVHFSQDFRTIPGHVVMHYVKSSAMVLYPPVTHGFEIDKLRVMMEDQGIDRANFVSAKKQGVTAGRGLPLFDRDGNITEAIDPQAIAAHTQVLDRSGLRIQQDNPYDEFKDEILTGSQMNKLFVDDIADKSFNYKGETLTGAELKQKKEDIRKELITTQINEFSNRIGAELVEGKLRILDKDKLLKTLEEEAISRNYSPNDLTMVQRKVNGFLMDGTPTNELAIPLFFNASSDRFESLLLSLVKKIGQVYLPGKSYIQASNAGFKFKDKKTFESLSAEDKNKIVWLPGYNGEELSTLKPNSPAQVLIPFQFLIKNAAGETENANVKDYLKLDENGNTVLDTDKIPKELTELIGFRIPTQKQNSMLPLQVAGFLPSTMGDTVVVPEAITKQMGSDFDVDKLYVYRRGYSYNNGKFEVNKEGYKTKLGADQDEYTELENKTLNNLESQGVQKNSKGRYDSKTYRQELAKTVREKYPNEKDIPTHKSYEGSTKESLTNDYFDIMWAVLTDEEMYSTVMKPLDTDDLKNEAARAESSSSFNNFFSPITQLEDYESQKDAKVMVGITSQFVTFNSWVQDQALYVGIREAEESEKVYFDEDNQPTTDLKPLTPSGIRFKPEGSSEIVHAYKLSGKAKAQIANEQTGEVVERSRVDDSVTIQNEVLDHAKNRVIDKLNINLNTIHAAEALIALGSENDEKASWKHAALFTRQPAIIALSEQLSRLGDSLSTTFETNLVNKTIDNLILQYVQASQVEDRIENGNIEKFLKDGNFDVIDIDKLLADLEEGDSPSKNLRQAGMLLTFKRLNEIGREMAKVQSTFNQDPKGPGKNMIEAFDSINNRQRMVDSGVIQGVEDLLNTEQGFIHTEELKIVEDTLQDILPYAGINSILTAVTKVTGRNQLSIDSQRAVVKSFKSFIFSNPELGLSNDVNFDRFRFFFGYKNEPTLAKRVWEAQQDTTNYFLKRLQPQIATTPNTPSYVFYLASQTSALDDQENMAAFLELLKDPKTKALAEDLVRYAYVIGGANNSFNFLKHIPADFLIELPFAAKLREVASLLNTEDSITTFMPFIDQWVRHNPHLIQKIEGDMIEGKNVPGERFKVVPAVPGSPSMKITSTQGLNNFQHYPEYLSYYNKDSNTWQIFRQSDDSLREYERIDTLGNKQTTEYTYSSEYNRSIIPENRAYIQTGDKIVRIDQTVEEKDVASEFNSLKQLGIDVNNKYEDRNDVVGLLADLAENEHVEKSLATVSMQLAEIFGELQNSKISLAFKPTEQTNIGGEIDVPTGAITINVAQESTSKNIMKSIVHEAMHGLTSLFTYQGASYQKEFPRAYKALAKVREVQQEALQAVLQQAQEEGISEERLRNILNGQGATTQMEADLANMYYLTQNADEFLSGIFENKLLQQFLNSKQSTLEESKKSILGKIIDFLTELIQALREGLGLPFQENSILHRGLERSYAFIQEVREVGNNLERNSPLEQAIGNTYFNGRTAVRLGWQVETLAEAKSITKQINKEFPMAKATYITNGDSFTVKVEDRPLYSVTSAPKHKEISNPIDRVYGKVQEQMQLIRASIAQNKKSPDVLRQSQLLAELRLLANDLKVTQDIEKIKTMANYQLNWAQKVRDKFLKDHKPVSNNQIMTAFRLLGVWDNTIRMMYDGADIVGEERNYDPDFRDIQAKASELLLEFQEHIMNPTFFSLTGTTKKDLESVEDMPAAEAHFLSIERAKSQITQAVAETIQDVHRNYLEEGQALLKQIETFEDNAKEVAKSRGLKTSELYKLFMHDNSDWGLITQYSPEFHKWKAGLRNKLNSDIEDAETNIGDDTLRSQAIEKAYNRYWRHLGKKAGFVDVRIMFGEDGTELDTSSAKKYKQEMIDEYGESFTNSTLHEAKEKFTQYVQDREDIFDMYDTQVEEGLMEASEAEIAKDSWDLENSPIHKLTTKVLVSHSKYLNLGEKYLTLVPHRDSKSLDGTSFFDNNYDKIQNDSQLKSIYDQIESFMTSFKGNLPYYVASKLGDNFLAAIRKELVTSIADVPAYLKGIPGRLIDSLTASSYQEFRQTATSREIPILYTDNPFATITRPERGAPQEEWDAYNKKKTEQAKNYTKDLPRILELFGLMSLHYKNFSEAKDAIELGEEILKKANSDMESGQKQINRRGKIVTVKASLKNTLGVLEYTKDVLMFKRSQNLQGRLGEITRKKDKTVEKKLRKLKADQEDLAAKYDNNEINLSEYEEGLTAISNEIKKYEVKRLYASKIADKLITWTQLKALSYNPLSAVNNLAFGIVSAAIHANGKQDFDWKSFRKAFSIMSNATGRSLGLARLTGKDSSMNKTAEKILNIMSRMNVMGELTDTQFSHSNLDKKHKGARAILQPYQMLRSGDYYVKALNMVAMLQFQKVTVNGEEVSLWSQINQEGAYINPETETAVPWTKLRNKVIAVNKIIMGNQDKSSPIWAKKNVLYRLVGQFRLSWFSEGIASRFEDEKDDRQLGRTRKGRYRTYADLGLLQSIGVMSKQLLSAIPGVKIDPFNNARLTNGKHFSDTDKANMRRNLAEIGWLLSFYSIAHLLGAIGGGEDDDKNRKKNFMFWANMSTRMYQDVGLYTNPSVFDTIIGTAAPALTTIRDVQRFITATIKLVTNDEYTSAQWFRKLTKAGFIPFTTLFNRFETMVTRDLSTIQR